MYLIKRTPEFDAWFEGLRDRTTSIRLAVRLDKAQRGILGDVKPVGDGVFEMREFFGPGWRMYYVQCGAVLIVMLAVVTSPTRRVTLQRRKSWLPTSISRMFQENRHG